MNKQNLAIGMALVAMLIAIGEYLFPVQVSQVAETFGAVGTRMQNGLCVGSTCSVTQNDMTIGNSGTALERVNTNECYFAPSAATIAASSSVTVDCQATAAWHASGGSALTGVTSGDNVVVMLSTTTSSRSDGTVLAGQGISITGCSASTTAGFIPCRVNNLTGTTYTWPTASAASGTASFIVTKDD